MKKILKNKKGITLVALVVTIIILLILAGISIATLTGSGLFEKAKLAKERTEERQRQEEQFLGDYENKIGEYVDGTRANGAKYKVIFDSSANVPGETYTLTESIENYDFLDVYARCFDQNLTGDKLSASQQQRIYVKDIDYINNTNYAFRVGLYYAASYYFHTTLKFLSSTTFYLTEAVGSNNSGTWSSPEIYRIIGYKYDN